MAERLVQNTQLATTFTDWDYHQADKDRCQLKKDGSFLFGGYMQIPRLAVSLVMTTSLGTDGPGADAPWKDFEIEKMMYGEGGDPNVFLGALFDPICEGGGSSAVLTTCEAEDEQSALGGLPQCAYILYQDNRGEERRRAERHQRCRILWRFRKGQRARPRVAPGAVAARTVKCNIFKAKNTFQAKY